MGPLEPTVCAEAECTSRPEREGGTGARFRLCHKRLCEDHPLLCLSRDAVCAADDRRHDLCRWRGQFDWVSCGYGPTFLIAWRDCGDKGRPVGLVDRNSRRKRIMGDEERSHAQDELET